MNLKTFLSVLLVYRSNFHVLHWMAKGKNFFVIHSKSDEYCTEILGDIDKVAEMVLRVEDSIVNYKDALDIIDEYEDHEFLLLPGDEFYDGERFKKASITMFKDILKCIEDLLESDNITDPKNVGIKATLEGMHDKYDLQARYLLDRFYL